MKSLTTEKVIRAYLVVVLVLAVLFSSPFQIGLALGLLAIQLFLVYKSSRPGLNLVLTLSTLVLAPLALESLVGVYAVLLIIPAVYLLDLSFKRLASTQRVSFCRVGRRASEALKRLFLGLFLVLIFSFVVWNFSLMLIASALLTYLGILIVYVLRNVPKLPLVEDRTLNRIIVGETETKKINIKGNAKIATRVHLEPTNNWVEVELSSFALASQVNIQNAVTFTPPLSGPSKLLINAVCVDSRGLIETGQVLEPIELHIIPRARFAQWLAKKYLEQSSSGTGFTVSIQKSNPNAAKHGVEFYCCRPYQSGDRLKDIDWKHSYMLRNLIAKEFSRDLGQVGVIVVDLTAYDANGADKLAYNLVMSALTLAAEGVPSSIAAYNNAEVVAATHMMNPREVVRKALELTGKIVIVESKLKVLGLADLRMVRRFIARLDRLNMEPAGKLSEILKFEVDVIEEEAKAHPSTLALSKVVKGLSGSAVITVVTSMYDSDALVLSLDRLHEKGYRTIKI